MLSKLTDALEKSESSTIGKIFVVFNQPRGLANDAQYRMMIRSKRARGSSDGTYNAIIDTMSKTLNCNLQTLNLLV